MIELAWLGIVGLVICIIGFIILNINNGWTGFWLFWGGLLLFAFTPILAYLDTLIK